MLHRLTVDQDVATVDRLQPCDGAQRRRLAAAGLAEQHDELAIGDLQVHVLDDLNRAEEFLDVTKLDGGHGFDACRDRPAPRLPFSPPNQLVNMKVSRPTMMTVSP